MMSINEGQPAELTPPPDPEDSGHSSSSEDGSEPEEDYDSEPYTLVDYSELRCNCGRKAKQRISRTLRNPLRPFFCCPKAIGNQCGFFLWADELSPYADKHLNEGSSGCSMCQQLKRRIDEIENDWDDERASWDREKMKLETQISALQDELDGFRKRIKIANESDLMPPVDKFSNSEDEDEDEDDKEIKHVVQK
ncbi:hypothetical protein ACJIZ3_001289 [Penstemon smallii]|uniref:GRF-type domain-containing protein n=1 Tax=Penstemon smallii TaxID=265156 RepID=A0ABD3U4X9_9LAMI